MELVDIIRASLADTIYKDCISEVDGLPYFRYDTEDSDPKEQWDNYIDVVEDLREKGFMLMDPYTEHDCITGTIAIRHD